MAKKKKQSNPDDERHGDIIYSSRPKKHSREEVIAAIVDSKGLVNVVAKRLQCSWRTARRRIDEYGLQNELITERELVLDFAELVLFEALNEKEEWAIKYFLNNQGKSRGYGWGFNQHDDGEGVKIEWNESKTYEIPNQDEADNQTDISDRSASG